MEQKIVTTKMYQAPIELVWKAWSDPALIRKWWGPDKFTCEHARIDFREGGIGIVSMKAPKEFGGSEWFNTWEYRKIIPMKAIEFDQRFSDKNGNRISPLQAGMPPDFPEVVFTQVSFSEKGDGYTEVIVTQHADMGQMTRNAKLGMEQSLEKMGQVFN